MAMPTLADILKDRITELEEEVKEKQKENEKARTDAWNMVTKWSDTKDILDKYRDAEEQGLLITIPKETDNGFISYIYQGSIYVVRIEHIGHVISKRKVTTFYHDFDEAEEVLKGSIPE
jgi:hypothetical protein